MVKPTLLVMAAGLGSRYGGMKQLDPIGLEGETMMDYSIFDARRAGFGRVVFVIRKQIEQAFLETLGTHYAKRIQVDCVFQEMDNLTEGHKVPAERVKPWGTTHAILMATGVIHEPFAVINADDFYGPESFQLLARHLSAGGDDYAMVGYVLRNTLSEFGSVARGVCHVSADGYLETIEELKQIEPDGGHAKNTDAEGNVKRLTADEVVSMNMWGFTPRVFGQLKVHFERFLDEYSGDLKAECYIPSTVNALLGAGEARVKVLRSTDSWFGVTYREDRPRAVDSIRKLVAGGYYPRRLWHD
ncbi:MAG TPA: sugar phosphate nucleotidyltransferase [Terracidiphilus sp.]|nr:sugar phosphate nucleotidyltransferase [Terracidiphilus sp.]